MDKGNKIDFEGNLENIDPKRLIDSRREDKIENFFLTLGLVYNDLKGLVLFQKLLEEKYRFAPAEEVSAHAGEYGGVQIQIHRLLAGILNEFFEFLQHSQGVLATAEFSYILKGVPKERREQWGDIVTVVSGTKSDSSDFINALERIRNNVAFHYYQSGKTLREGFINRFFSNVKEPRNSSAYYSVGNNMSDTRFYYCDAAAEQFLFTTSYKVSGGGHEQDILLNQDYKILVDDVVHKMNFTIYELLKEYLKRRPYK